MGVNPLGDGQCAIVRWDNKKPLKRSHFKDFIHAEKPGFEPGLRLSHTTPLAGEPLRPLGYFSMSRRYAVRDELAEREGFEPPVSCDITGFQDQRHQPLGHLSGYNQLLYYSMGARKRQVQISKLGATKICALWPVVSGAARML